MKIEVLLVVIYTNAHRWGERMHNDGEKKSCS